MADLALLYWHHKRPFPHSSAWLWVTAGVVSTTHWDPCREEGEMAQDVAVEGWREEEEEIK